jgi:protein-L-isoaspartate(D-aspartate) O-methyltransferase
MEACLAHATYPAQPTDLAHVMLDPAAARSAMVSQQLAARGIRDARVLAALARVPRERFVPEAVFDQAYADQALPIGEGQTISQPFMVALMTEALELTGDERVLEIGTGSGYQTAILSDLAQEIISIERLPRLAEEARQRLAELGCRNVDVRVGDGSLGYPSAAPYGAILVAAAAPRVPDALQGQLADGGRLAIPVGPHGHQDLVVVRREGDRFVSTVRESCVFVPLLGEGGWRLTN